MADTSTEPGAELTHAYTEARRALVALARVHFEVFCEVVLRDEHTGQPLSLAPMHRDWCALLDAHPRLVLMAHIESGKSQLLSVGRVLWALGHNPNLRCAVLSNTHTMALRMLRSVAKYIEQSPELHEVFPALRPGKPWCADTGVLTVDRPTLGKDASLVATGLHGSVLGSRLDLLVADDIEDWESTRSPEARARTLEWFHSTMMGRLTASARVVVVGTPWHTSDLLGVLAASPAWVTHRYPVTDDSGAPRWPERWSLDRIAQKRRELGPLDSARQLDVVARDDDTAVFKAAWIEAALDRGKSRTLLGHLLHTPQGARVITGVDLAVARHARADLSAIVTVMANPDGTRDLLEVMTGRWAASEIVGRVINTSRRFGSMVVIEDVGAQAYVRDIAREAASSTPIVGFTTGRGRTLQWEAERLAAEMSNNRWAFPAGPEVDALARDLLHYSPRVHTADRIAALCLARWGSEQQEKRAEYGRLNLGVR